jgi:hypothetical protein
MDVRKSTSIKDKIRQSLLANMLIFFTLYLYLAFASSRTNIIVLWNYLIWRGGKKTAETRMHKCAM